MISTRRWRTSWTSATRRFRWNRLNRFFRFTLRRQICSWSIHWSCRSTIHSTGRFFSCIFTPFFWQLDFDRHYRLHLQRINPIINDEFHIKHNRWKRPKSSWKKWFYFVQRYSFLFFLQRRSRRIHLPSEPCWSSFQLDMLRNDLCRMSAMHWWTWWFLQYSVTSVQNQWTKYFFLNILFVCLKEILRCKKNSLSIMTCLPNEPFPVWKSLI